MQHDLILADLLDLDLGAAAPDSAIADETVSTNHADTPAAIAAASSGACLL